MVFDRNGIETALNALNDQLVMLNSPLIELVICGGSALQALGLIDRTTRDLDILALVSQGLNGLLQIESAKVLPSHLISAAKIVTRDFNLPDDWLNSGPTDLLSQGLPFGFVERLESKSYGTCLQIYFISRFDQICFKMYAAVNGGSERHLGDLFELHPSDEELLFAANWCLTQDASEIFPLLVKDFLRKVGYSNVAERII